MVLGSRRAVQVVEADLRAICGGRAPSSGGKLVASMGTKGQSGKTTAIAVLGTLLSPLLAGVTIGADFNPDKGTLIARAGGRRHEGTKRLVELAQSVTDIRYPDELNAYLDAVGRFHLLHNDHVIPELVAETSGEQYAQVLKVLRHFAGLTLIDGGTSLIHPAMTASFSTADHLVIACKASPEAINLAVEGTQDLRRTGFEGLVLSASVIITIDDPKVRASDFDQGIRFFQRLCNHVEVVGYDAAAGSVGAIDWPRLKTATNLAYGRFALAVARSVFGEPAPVADEPSWDTALTRSDQQ